MAGAQRFAPSRETKGSHTAKSSQVRDLDVQAIWNGHPQHPAHVKIHCTIKPGSGFQISILECDDGRVAVISVVGVKHFEPADAERGATPLRQCSDDFSGETLTGFNAALILKDSFKVTPSMSATTSEQKRHLLPCPGDVFSDRPPWAKDLPCAIRQTSANAIGAYGYVFLETKDNDCMHLVSCNSLIDDNRSTSADTVEIHLVSRPTSPIENDGVEPSDILEQGGSEGADDKALEFSDANADGSPRKLRIRKRRKRSERQAQKGRTPWQSPSTEDFAPKSKDSNPVQPSTLSPPPCGGPRSISKSDKLDIVREMASENSNLKLTNPLRQISGNCLDTGTPGPSSSLKQPLSALGRLRATTPYKKEENAVIPAKPFFSEPRATKPTLGQPVQLLTPNEVGQGWFSTEDVRVQGNERSSPHILTPITGPPGFPSQLQDQPNSQKPSPTTCIKIRGPSKTYMPHNSGHSQQSSRTTCMKARDTSKSCMPHGLGQKPEVDSNPNWVIEDGMLVIYFPESITLTPFEIEVEAEVHLVSIDGYDWQSFSLAVFPDLDPGQVSGLFSFTIEPVLGQSDIPDAQFRTESLFDSQVVAANQITGMFIAAERLQLALRFKRSILAIPFYTMEVGLCGTAIWSDDDGFQIKYRASLAVEHPDYDVFADQITLYLNIKNWSSRSQTYYLSKGETFVALRKDHQLLDRRLSDPTEASLAIVRDAADIGLPCELAFTISYGRTSPTIVALPHIHPADGKVVTEIIRISDLLPGLFVEHRASPSFSTWKTTVHIKDDVRIYRFDRNPIPFAFPEGLKDDVMVKLTRQAPVHFKALEEPSDPVANVTSENVVQNFKLIVSEMLGGMLECRMTLDVQVTNSCQLLTIDHHDWNPKLSLVDGRLATEDSAEWRETVDGNSTLFKTERVIPGQTVRVEFQWDEWDILDEFKDDDCKNFVVYDLPRVVGKTVLAGSLQCSNVNGGTVTLDDGVGETVYQCIDRLGIDRVRLPTLHDGYKMALGFRRDQQTTCSLPPKLDHSVPTQATPPRVLFVGGMPLATRQVRFVDEPSEVSSDDVEELSATVVEDSELESIISSEFDENPLPGLTGSSKCEKVMGKAMVCSTVPAPKTRSSLGWVTHRRQRWCCLLGLGLSLLKLLDPNFDAATTALKYVHRITPRIEQLALSVVPVRMDDATVRIQVPRQHPGNNEDATTRVQEWVLSVIADGDVGAQATGAGSDGDTEMAHYKSFEVTDGDSARDGMHSAGGTDDDRSVRDWIDYTLGWKGRHE